MLFYEVLVSSNFRLIEKWIYLRIMCVVINWSWLKYISIWTPILLLLFVCFFVCYFVTWSFSVFWTFCSDLWLVLSQEHRLWVINWSWLRYISIWTPILLLLFVCLFVLFCFVLFFVLLLCYMIIWCFLNFLFSFVTCAEPGTQAAIDNSIVFTFWFLAWWILLKNRYYAQTFTKP